ncbi:hypothetical protein DGMP_24660 [Desulfomarina profundi]|uniref:DUF2279 domain-containing protein n=1 Tax=Desulfomarina profundi TaxID=2772557 RepID=A0A8D5JDY4_9BACT|nr:DUF2279 domain-containing protein [Desulfomarina profundi]BCL61773.1 hypothetical protein DGMP_24660 [Desulfomarina profundi]
MNTQLFLITVVFLSFTCNSYADVVSTRITKNPLTHSSKVEQSLDNEKDWWMSQSKEKKMFYTNLTAAAAIGIWGLATWDYGSSGLHTSDEGWFEHDSKYGGADKLGHFWATYTFSDALTGLYKNWGYDSEKASAYAAFSAWTVQLFMELGDATSETQGFDWGI